MNDETSLIAFKAICNFVNDLDQVYGKRHKPLKLYKRLVNHTQISHDSAIRKHISLYYDFCSANREALTAQDSTKIVQKRIEYSPRVYIDMESIFKMADGETSPVIWRHLLTISAIIDPTGKAKEILRKNATEGNASTNETDFLTNLISNVEKNVKPDSNPMEAISSIMQSGLLTEMMSDISSKKLDLGKMLGAVQGLVSSLGDKVGDDPDAKQAMNMLNSAMGSMTTGGNGGGAPDLSGMMQMMTSLMSGMNNQGAVVEEVKTD